MNLKDYEYILPDKNLALSPAVPRDSAKLLIYDTKTDRIGFDRFYNLDKHLPQDSFLVLNNTKVLPARVEMKKETGGKVIVLFLINELASLSVVKAMADRKINVGDKLYFKNGESVEIVNQDGRIFNLKYDFSKDKLFDLLKKYGEMPIPPYLKKTTLKRDELIEKYQTIFGAKEGSSAAPTASLHFTDKLFKKLEKKGIEKYFITLHVGLGTFAPLTDENMKTKKLHEEYFDIDKKTLNLIKAVKTEKKNLVAVGTTVVRSLESAVKNFITRESPLNHSVQGPSKVKNFSPPSFSTLGKTYLFIFPPYNFRMVDCLITNFHLPKSSLMMLVEAFLQFKGAKKSLIDLYKIAINNNFRFYSFGDAMLIV